MKINSKIQEIQKLRKLDKFVESMNDRLLQPAVSMILTDNGIRKEKSSLKLMNQKSGNRSQMSFQTELDRLN